MVAVLDPPDLLAPPSAAARLNAVFDCPLDFALLGVDVDGIITDWSAGAQAMLGWTRQEIVGRSVDCLCSAEGDRQRNDDLDLDLDLDAARRRHAERWHVRKDGHRFWASRESQPLRGSDGELLGFLVVLQDRTEQRAAAAAQAAEAEFMRGVLVSSNDCFKVLDLEGRLEFMSEGGQRVMEVSEFSRLRGRSWLDFWEGAAREEALEAVRAARAGGIGRFRAPARTAAGNLRHWDVQVTPILGPGGKPEKLLSISRDVTELQRAEAAVQQLNRHLAQRIEERTRERDLAWKHSRDLQVVLSGDGLIHAVSDAWRGLLGWDSAELIGKPFLDFVHPEDRSRSAEAWGAASWREVPSFENRYRHRDGSYRWFAWVSAPSGGLVYASGRHVTLEKEAAASLEVAQEQLRQAQKMEAVGQLTGGLAHDFNNLLAGISGSLELMSRRLVQGTRADFERYIKVALSASKRAAALTHRLLAFSRRQTLEPRPTDIQRLVLGLEELVRRTMGPSVSLSVLGAPGLWNANIDPHQLENALLNLCINARDAMPDGGRLVIEVANRVMDERAARERELQPGPYVSLSVTDTGTGMPPEVVQHIFEPFYTTKPMGVGTGLGLSMVYGFAIQSGGQVRAYSRPGLGTTMSLYLPRHLGPAEEAEAIGPLPDLNPGETLGKVLVVDDESHVREVMIEALGDMGCICSQAADGAGGLAILQSGAEVDLLITDVGMPGGMNGRQLADAGRLLRPGLKVLLVTGYAEHAVLGDGNLDPGMHILTKPFDLEQLALQVRAMMRSAKLELATG